MKLSFETVKEITQGVSYITESKQGVQFHRFNVGEEEYYKNAPWPRHYSTAGVKLSFSTNSTTMKLKVNVEAATPTRYFSHDIFCNGKCIGNIRNFTDEDLPIKFDEKTLLPAGDFDMGIFEAEFDLGEGIKEISIVFPWSVNSMLQELILDDDSDICSIKKDYRIVSYGDSITYGASTSFPSNRYVAKVAEFLDAEEICKGVGGENFHPELLNYSKENNVKFVIVAYGTNDVYNDFEYFKGRCNGFFERISSLYSEALIFAISPIWRKDCENEDGFTRMKQIENQIEKTVSQYENTVFINGYDLVPFDISLFADKCLHPNDEGFEYYYKNLKSKIEKFI